MSKVSEYFNELDELNGHDEPVEPTDTELAEIENKLDTISWEDMNWDND